MVNISAAVLRRKMPFLLLVLIFYIPFLFVTVLNFDIVADSLSSIAWSKGGILFLVGYAMITIPMFTYLSNIFLQKTNTRAPGFKIFSVACVILLALTVIIPYGREMPAAVIWAHRICSFAGGGMGCIAVAIALTCYIKNKNKKSAGPLLKTAAPHILIGLVLAITFLAIRMAALFEIGVSIASLATLGKICDE